MINLYYISTLIITPHVDLTGSFKTPAPVNTAFDFTFAVASCAWTGSTSKVIDRIIIIPIHQEY